MSATERVVSFICETDGGSIPADVRELARRAILDTVGVTLAGVDEPPARLARGIAAGEGGASDAPRATLLGTELTAPLAGAALANGTAGHALDYDDVTAAMNGHPSVPLVPAIFAIGEAERSSGAEIVTAFATGFEVECKIGRALGASHYARGFHQTTTLGALGAAAASAQLLRLGREQTAHALGIASSLAGGLRANFGSMTKPLQAGNAARGGVLAALLARDGFTGGEDILDGHFGFVSVFSPAGDGDAERIDGFGEPWELSEPGLSVKKYPCCFVSHRPADATLSLVARHALTPALVERIEVHVPRAAIGPTGNVGPLIHSRPQTGLEGKFSLEYVVAAALFDRELTFANFEDSAVQRAELQAFIPKVTAVADDDLSVEGSGLGGSYNRVEIHTTDGRVLSEQLREPRGGPSSPLSWDQLLAKYRDCASRALDAAAVERSAELLVALDDLDDVRTLTETLAAVPAGARV